MTEKNQIRLFNEKKVRTAWDCESEEWYFSVIDVVDILTDSKDPAAYWRKLKQRLKAEGNETVTNCHSLKMSAADGKVRMKEVVEPVFPYHSVHTLPQSRAFQAMDGRSCGYPH